MKIEVGNVKRLFDILPHQSLYHPKEDSLCDKIGGSWRKYSSQNLEQIVNKMSLGFLNLGLNPTDKVAIISYNRTEWTIVDLSVLQFGGVDVPLYPTMNKENYEYILNDSQVKIVFVENDILFEKIKSILPRTPSVKEIYTFNHVGGAKHWSEVYAINGENFNSQLEEYKNAVTEENLATIIYTSGTTGTPKGVELTHKNILSNVKSIQASMPHSSEHTMLSFLPICHIFERAAVYFYMYIGGSVYFAEGIEKVGDNLREVRPHYFTTVPRLIEKIYDRIMEKGRTLSGAKKAIFFWAVNHANNFNPEGKNNFIYNIKLKIARKLVFSKWIEALGGNVIGIISGAAALQPRLARIFSAAGVPICEGYGLTETSPVLTCNRFEEGKYFLGTVGLAIPDVEIKIAENGEILAKGPNVMNGYHNLPDATKTSIDADGWFHTGDVGEIINGKFLKITDRLKEIFKTSGGKFVAPLPIENKIKESNFITEIMVVGENQKHPAAIIVPNFDFIKKWGEKKSLTFNSNQEICASQDVKNKIFEEVEKFNQRFDHTQQIKKIELIFDTWGVETGELTPTLKLKRKILVEKYKYIIEKIYSE